ncbi:MAG: hypothetical protein PHQ65_05870 [Bacteroidales bacterium]|nr:hypothetical protein [Bacteroidales bacterium]
MAVADDASNLNVAQGIGTATFKNLTPNTTYYIKMFAYTGSGSLIDYKTDGDVPQAVMVTAP